LNYAGKFDATISADGQGGASHSLFHVDSVHGHAPADAIVVPDAHFLFHADFKRSGLDLVLHKDDHELVLHDYFKGEKHAALASPDGAHLTADIVEALTGSVEVAQAGSPAAAGQIIGHVTKLVGNATVIRNGVSIILNMGDNVEKGDVVQSGSGSTLGITFIDGTVFGLSSNARMVLNEMIYDPNGSNNSSLLSLVAGTITFVAGETAKHGDMKVDTPVATMGIRGTAVLVEIDFTVPGQGGTPDAHFQVLVEPDGRTGSYILFDKSTLQPLAVVNQAGQQINISNGVISQSSAPLSPDVEKLIQDVFTLKFSANDTNPKTTTAQTDTTNPLLYGPLIQLADKTTAQPIYQQTTLVTGNLSTTATPNNTAPINTRVPGAPTIAILDPHGNPTTSFALTELAGKTGDTTDFDTVGGVVNFVDPNAGDLPTASIALDHINYNGAVVNDQFQLVSGSLSKLQLQDIAGAGITIKLVPASTNNNNGSATLTYSVADKAFDFLAAGETLVLTYVVKVDNNYAGGDLAATQDITITITGTNDAPVFTTSAQTVDFSGGRNTHGGTLRSGDPTSGALDFTDVDLDDTHTVAVSKFTAVMSNGTQLSTGLQDLFEKALTVSLETDSTGTGNGVVDWKLEQLPVYLADFIPTGQTLTLTYTVTVADSQGASDHQTVTVTITGTDNPAVVWIATTTGEATGASWSNAANWETDAVPTATDDVIIITDQLIGLKPNYPVTIDEGTLAFAHSLTMNDYAQYSGLTKPELDNSGSLTISGQLLMYADSILRNYDVITVGDAAEFHDTSLLENVGSLFLENGGEFTDSSRITNEGAIQVIEGTLDVSVDVSNLGQFYVDSRADLVLNSGTIDGGDSQGTLTIAGTLDLEGTSFLSNGTLANIGQVNVSGTVVFDNQAVTNDGSGAIDITGALTLQSGSNISNGETSTVTVEIDASLTLADTSSIAGSKVTNNGALNLEGDSALKSGTLTNSGDVNVSGSGVVFDREAVTNNGEGAIDIAGALTLLDGSSISNGEGNTITLESEASLTLQDTSSIVGGILNGSGTIFVEASTGATLDGVSVFDDAIQVDDVSSPATLILDGGTTITESNVSIGSIGTLEASTAAGATLASVAVDNSGLVQIDDGALLQLTGGSYVSGGDVNNAGALDLVGKNSLQNGTLENSGHLNVSGNGGLHGETVSNTGTFEIDATGALTIDQGSTVTGDGQIRIDRADLKVGQLILNDATLDGASVLNHGAFDLTGSAVLKNGTLEDDNYIIVSGVDNALHNENVTVGGAIVVSSDGALTIDQGSTVTDPYSLEVDGTLALNDASIDTGVVYVDSGGTVNITGSTALTAGKLYDVGQVNISGTGNVLDGETVSNTESGAIDITGTLRLQDASSITNGEGNAETVESDASLTLSDTSHISGGLVTNDGTLNLAGSSELGSGRLDNTESVNVSGGGVVFDGETVSNTGTGGIDITGALTLENASSITSGESNAVTVESDASLTLSDTSSIVGGELSNAGDGYIEASTGATFDGVSVDNSSGTIHVDAAALSAILILDDGTSITGGHLDLGEVGTLEVSTEGGATLSGVTVDNSGVVQVDEAAILALAGSSIENGIVVNDGTINSTGTSAIDGADITNDGVIEALSGTLTIDPGTLTNSSTLEADGGELDISGETVGNTGTVGATGGGTLKLISSTIDNTGDGTVTVDAGSTLDLDQSGISGGTLTIFGTLDNIAGANTITSSVTVEDGGSIVVSGGSLDLAGSVAGDVDISGGGTVELGASGTSAYAQTTVVFETGSSGTLVLDHAGCFTGTITGLDDNTIDLADISYASNPSVSYANGVLSVFVGGVDVANLDLTGDYSGVHWVLGPDSSGGTTLTEAPGAISGLDSNGNADQGTALSVSITDGGAAVTGATYHWQVSTDSVNWTDAHGNNGLSSYTPVEADEGQSLRVSLSFTDSNGKAEASTVSAGVVQEAPAAPTSFATRFLHFDGNSAAVGPVATSNVGNGSDGATLQGWVNWDGKGDAGSSQLLFYNGSASDAGFGVNGVVTESGQLDLQIQHGGISGDDTGITIAAGQWHNIALTHVDGSFTLYIDGVAEYTLNEDVYGVPGGHPDFTLIGGAATDGGSFQGEGFHGSIANVSVWNTALTQTQVETTQFTALTGSETGLAAYFPLNDGGGTAAQDLVNSTGNLTVVGNPVWQTGESAAVSLSGLDENDNAVQGQQITALVQEPDAPASGVSYTWTVGGQVVKTATDAAGDTYTPTEADEGKAISVAVSFTDTHGFAETGSAGAGVVQEGGNDLVATLDSTTAQQGATIHVTGVTDGGVAVSDVSYDWQVSSDGINWTEANGNNGQSSYTPVEADGGLKLRLLTTLADDPSPETATNDLGVVSQGDHDLVTTLSTSTVEQGLQITVTGVTDDERPVTSGLSYSWQVSSDGTDWTQVNTNSYYAPTEQDEGKSLRLVTSYIEPDGNTDQTVNQLGTVGDIAPTLVAPFSFAVDEMKVVKNGHQVFDDNFAQAPPVAGTFGDSTVQFITQGSMWTDVGGKGIMSAAGVQTLPTVIGAEVLARLGTNNQDESVSNGGLKEDATFTVSTTFDLTVPQFAGQQYGIDLNDSSATHANDEMVELYVVGDGHGGATIKLVQADFATTTFKTLASETLTADQLAGNNQIELDLAHLAANSSAITGSFKLLNDGSVTSSKIFDATAHVFNNTTYTRADIFAFAPTAVVITGEAQQGQTLTANTVTNEADATINYEWQHSSDGVYWSDIGTDSSTYVVQESDQGFKIRVIATAADADNSHAPATATSAATSVVPGSDSAPSVSLGELATVTSPPDDLQHSVFPNISIDDHGQGVDHASVTWTNLAGGVGFVGVTWGEDGTFDGISVSYNPVTGGYDLTGKASVADYDYLLSHLAYNSWQVKDGTTFTVSVGEGSTNGAPVTSTVDVAVPTSWDVWTGNCEGPDWSDSGNWSLGHVPGQNDGLDFAYINSPQIISYDLSFGGNQSLAQLHVLTGSTLELTSTCERFTLTVTGVENSDGSYAAGLHNDGIINVQGFAELAINGDVLNDGTLKAQGLDAFITIGTGTVSLYNGSIHAFDGAEVDFNSATVLGGQIFSYSDLESDSRPSLVDFEDSLIGSVELTGHPEGSFEVSGGATTSFSGVTIDSGTQVTIDPFATLVLEGTINNSGNIVVDGIEAGATLSIEGTVTLHGGGTITLDGLADTITGLGGTSPILDNINDTVEGVGAIIGGGLTLINDAVEGAVGGTIVATGGELLIEASTITNHAVMHAEDGGTLQVGASDGSDVITNLSADPNLSGGAVLTGGEYGAADSATGAGSQIDFGYDGAITTLNARAGLAGANSMIYSGGVALENSLELIGSSGELVLAGNTTNGAEPTQHFVDPNAVEVAGQIELLGQSGTSFDAAALTIDSGAIVHGSGEISTKLTNDGTIAASGSLEVAAPISGNGTLEIHYQGTLEIDPVRIGNNDVAAVSVSGQTIQFDSAPDGTSPAYEKLVIGGGEVDSSTFNAIIKGFGMSDSIDLTGVGVADSWSFDGSTLTVSQDGTTIGSLSFAGLSADTKFAVASDGHGGTDIVLNGPMIDTSHFSVQQNEDGSDAILGLQVSDSDPASAANLTLSATTAGAPVSTISPSSGSGSVDDINNELASGITYNPGSPQPQSDMVNVTVSDNFGGSETVHFDFNQGGQGPNINLTGTTGNNVIFGTGNSDTLTGNGGEDQFVFAPTSGPTAAQHTITDFNTHLDTIDLRQFTNINTTADALATAAQQGNDTLLRIDSQDTILLKNVIAANLHASDFIVTPH
jgi:hypothetical protein